MGGAISGYCAIGSVNRATLPPSTMTMDSTEAKIGRLMKNRENILSYYLVPRRCPGPEMRYFSFTYSAPPAGGLASPLALP